MNFGSLTSLPGFLREQSFNPPNSLQTLPRGAFCRRWHAQCGNKIVQGTLYSEQRYCARKDNTMSVAWGSRWRSFWASGKNLATAWMITAGVVALYVGVIRSNEITGGINNSKATGLARPRRAEPIALWRQMRILPQTAAWRDQESTADTLVGEPTNQIRMMSALSGSSQAPAAAPEDADADQKMVRTSSIDLVVRKPAETAEQIRNVAEGLGGFLVSSQVSGSQDATGGSLTIRVPAPRFEEARQKIRNFGVRVESERIEAQEVTRQYVDEDANLRNLRAEEQQYLSILRQARTVKDTLDVSGKLSGVRGQIEQQRAEFEVLTKQIETVSITVSLRSEAEARVFGLNWRPLYQMKLALRDGLDGLANYASAMASFVFFLPTIILWLATIAAVSAVSWRVLRWVGRRWFARKVAETPVHG
jgi:hypothetical protein